MEEVEGVRSPGAGVRLRASLMHDPALGRHEERLLVRDVASGRVVGDCRILSPVGARRAGGYAAERAFDLAMLEVLRERMVEMSGPRIHRGYRSGAIVHLLGSSLARYLVENRYDYVIASVDVPLQDGGHAAAAAFRAVSECQLSPVDLRAVPRARLPLEALGGFLPARTPAPLRAFLDLGAWVCGEPALDGDFACGVFPVLLPLARMRGRYARQFLARAA